MEGFISRAGPNWVSVIYGLYVLYGLFKSRSRELCFSVIPSFTN